MAQLVGFDNFKRSNPRSDRFDVRRFDHVEFVCGDAATTAARLERALGLHRTARTCVATGNHDFSSYVLSSDDVHFIVTAPTSASETLKADTPSVTVSPARMHAFTQAHGLAVFAVGIEVADARVAFEAAVAGGAIPHAKPRWSPAEPDVVVSEVRLHADGDAVVRFLSGATAARARGLPFLPGYAAVEAPPAMAARRPFTRVDHVVSNVPDLLAAINYVTAWSGFHEFAEFASADVGTVDSGLNSMVLANNSEMVLMPFNEPTMGTRRKSQIQTFLDQHGGPGVQHIALKTDDVCATVAAMRAAHEEGGGLELMDRPRAAYYKELKQRIGADAISDDLAKRCEELGILVDRDDQGVLLQIFTKPLGDRATFFIEVIQRVGCDTDPETNARVEQLPGCGGFGKGNFTELFRAIEEYETRAGLNRISGS